MFGDVDGIRIKLIDKREFDASIVGTDPKSDVAVLQIDAENLTDIKMGNSSEIRVGEWVMAVGSPFSEFVTLLQPELSQRSVEAILWVLRVRRLYSTDAAINPGNSGGALLNMNGDLLVLILQLLRVEVVGQIGVLDLRFPLTWPVELWVI